MKYIYFFRPNLKNHFHLYYSWIEAARKNSADVTMFTAMSSGQKQEQLKEFDKIKHLDGVEIIITPHVKLNDLYVVLYLLKNILYFGGVSLIAKKVNLRPLNIIKKFFPKKFKYALELEGDVVSELDYLKKRPYKKGYYDSYIASSYKVIRELPDNIFNADRLLVLSNAFKKTLCERYDFLTEKSVKVISTGFIKNRFSFNESRRNAYRDELRLDNETCFIYVGNLHYSWQNIKLTLEFFDYYIKNVDSTAKFLIISHKTDHEIAKGFICKLGIDPKCIILREVPNDDIVGYYNAADICVLLRENDLMNMLASPGKIGEYAASGTPLLSSTYIGDYSTLLQDEPLASLIDDINDFKKMALEVKRLLKVPVEDKKAFSKWSNEALSSESNVDSFIKAFKY